MYIGRYWGYLLSRRASASGIFVSNDIPNFEAFLRKSIYSFTIGLSELRTQNSELRTQKFIQHKI